MSLINLSNRLDILNNRLGVDTNTYDIPEEVDNCLNKSREVKTIRNYTKDCIEAFNTNDNLHKYDNSNKNDNKLVIETEDGPNMYQYEYSVQDESGDKNYFLNDNEIQTLVFPENKHKFRNPNTGEEYTYNSLSNTLTGYEYPTTEPTVNSLEQRINSLYSIIDNKTNNSPDNGNNTSDLNRIDQNEVNQVRRNLYSFNKDTYDNHIENKLEEYSKTISDLNKKHQNYKDDIENVIKNQINRINKLQSDSEELSDNNIQILEESDKSIKINVKNNSVNGKINNTNTNVINSNTNNNKIISENSNNLDTNIESETNNILNNNNINNNQNQNIIKNNSDLDNRNNRIITYLALFVVIIISYILIYKFLQ
jgi:hypothetical protein